MNEQMNRLLSGLELAPPVQQVPKYWLLFFILMYIFNDYNMKQPWQGGSHHYLIWMLFSYSDHL